MILLERTLISFRWKYGKDEGLGTFTEEYSDLVIGCTFGIDGQSRFKPEIDSAKITN